VAAEGLTVEQFRRDLRDQLTLTRLRDREIEQKVKISDTEVDQFISEQRQGANAAFAPDINIAQLLVIVPEGASDADIAKLQQRALDLAKRARAGEDFAALVRDNSDAPDRSGGGALGMRSADRYPPLFVDATQSTPVGGIAGPLRSPAGFHILKLLAKSQPGAPDAAVTQTEARHILLLNDPKRSTAQAVAQLADYKERIARGTADFATLARENSQDGSAKDGGELGWSRPGQFVPEFDEAMNRLAIGEISDPVVSRFGVHLIQVEARRDAKLTQSEQREAARAVLRQKKIEQATETWVQEVRGRAYVEYRDSPQS
jgi:peptidyl-prolyl cis-trans isomerase SurA